MLRRSLLRLTSLPIDRRTPKFSTLLPTAASSSAEQLCAQLHSQGPNVEKTLATTNAKIEPLLVSEVLRRCSVDRRPLLGLRFFVWAGTQSDYRHSSHMYGRACEIFQIRRNPRVIVDVLESYGAEGFSISVKTVKVVLNLCREAELADEALWVLRKMSDFNLRADTVSYNVVIRLFCRRGDVVTAEELTREMGSVGLQPDMVTFVEMIKGFCDAGRLDEAVEVFEEMKEQGCIPNVVVFSALLDGFCRKGSLERAMELLTEMEKRDGDCGPNVVTYTSVIQSLCSQGLTLKALAVLDRMIHRGCAPNRVTARTLIHGLCAEGHLKEADELIDKVVSCGSVSTDECNSFLVVSLIRLEKLEEAERRFGKMLSCGMRPDGRACNMILSELCSKARPLDAFLILQEIDKAGCSSFIGSDVFSALLMRLFEFNHREEAVTLARLMLDRGIRLRAPYAVNVLKCLQDSGGSELVSELT